MGGRSGKQSHCFGVIPIPKKRNSIGVILLQTIQNHLIFSFQIFPLLSLPVENSPKKRSKSTKLLKPPCSTFSIFGALCCTSACHLNQPSHSELAAILLISSYVSTEQNHWASPFLLFWKKWYFCWSFHEIPDPTTATILRNPNLFFYSKKNCWLTPSLVPDLPLDLKATPSVSHHACCGGNHTSPPRKQRSGLSNNNCLRPVDFPPKSSEKKGSGFQDCVFSTQLLPKKMSFVSRKTSKRRWSKT